VGEKNILKICDFGWCCHLDNEQSRNTFCGTLEYMAPEMLLALPHNHQLDVWSLGILLYELCHGSAPFRGNQVQITKEICQGHLVFKKGLSREYKELVT